MQAAAVKNAINCNVMVGKQTLAIWASMISGYARMPGWPRCFLYPSVADGKYVLLETCKQRHRCRVIGLPKIARMSCLFKLRICCNTTHSNVTIPITNVSDCPHSCRCTPKYVEPFFVGRRVVVSPVVATVVFPFFSLRWIFVSSVF